MFSGPTELLLVGFDRINLDTKDPNQIHRHQKPTRRHTDKGKIYTWWMESFFVFVQHQPFQFHQLSWNVIRTRSVTKWTQACDRRLTRLISYTHHINDFRQYCRLGNTALHCSLGLLQDSDFAGDLEDSASTSASVLCIFGGTKFVPVSWMCKKNCCLKQFYRIWNHLSGCWIACGQSDWSIMFN